MILTADILPFIEYPALKPHSIEDITKFLLDISKYKMVEGEKYAWAPHTIIRLTF
jgi:hypothetical protein